MEWQNRGGGHREAICGRRLWNEKGDNAVKAYGHDVTLVSDNDNAYMHAEHVADGVAVTGTVGGVVQGDGRVTCLLLNERAHDRWMLAQFDSAAAAEWWLAHTGKEAGWRRAAQIEELAAQAAGAQVAEHIEQASQESVHD